MMIFLIDPVFMLVSPLNNLVREIIPKATKLSVELAT